MGTNKKCVMVSIDAATASTGYTIWHNAEIAEQDRFFYDKQKYKDHTQYMRETLLGFLDRIKPDIIVIEDVPFKKNIKTYKLLQRTIATVETWAMMHDTTFWEFTPSQWHSLVKNAGEKVPRKREELKQWSIGKTGISQDDISDSQLIGLAYINMCRAEEKRSA